MSNIWGSIKRHKGKIITGGIVVSGIAAYILQMKEQHQLTPLDVCSQDALKAQARCHYIFDTNHRACDQSITGIVPTISTLVQRRFDVEALIYRLKESKNLPVEEKLQIWDRMKVLCIARVIGIAYSYSLLILALKAQVSILAADVCSQFERPQSQSWICLAKSHFADYFGLNSSSNPASSTDTSSIAANRKVFMQCIQYFMLTGISKLLDVIEDISNQVCSTVSLTENVSMDKIRDVLNQGDRRLAMLDSSFYSQLIAPLSDADKISRDGVMKLLVRLVSSIESKKFRETLSSLVDFYLTAAVHKMSSEPVVLAKLLPYFPDVFRFISSVDFDSPLQNSLCSSDVYHFANFVFKTI